MEVLPSYISSEICRQSSSETRPAQIAPTQFTVTGWCLPVAPEHAMNSAGADQPSSGATMHQPDPEGVKALSHSLILLVSPAARSKIARRKIKQLEASRWEQIPPKTAHSWRV
jgi:hypothetical protein